MTTKKPDVGNAQSSNRPATLDLADVAQRRGLFRPHIVVTPIARRLIHHGNPLMVVVDLPGKVRRNHDFIVGMGDDDQDVCLEAGIGRPIVCQVAVRFWAVRCLRPHQVCAEGYG